MSYNAKNYNAQGGDSLVIGGSVDVAVGGKITAAGTQAAVIACAADADAAAVRTAVIAIIAALKGAGIIASE